MNASLKDKVKGSIYGFAIGDAMGATTEFMSKEEIKQRYGILKDIVGGGWLNLKSGEWTDDTDMMLAVAEGIITAPGNPVPRIGKAFMRWEASKPKDIGGTIRLAFHIWKEGGFNHAQWEIAARKAHEMLGGQSAGNGALMRTLPVGIAYMTVPDIYYKTMNIARMTHWDVRAGLTSAIYSLIIRNILNGAKDREVATIAALLLIEDMAREDKENREALEEILTRALNWRSEADLRPTGYTVDTLVCALWSFHTAESFEEAIIKAVNLGGDADTIAAITGGLAGAYWGYSSIPERWLKKFTQQQKEQLGTAIEGLLRIRTRNTRKLQKQNNVWSNEKGKGADDD